MASRCPSAQKRSFPLALALVVTITIGATLWSPPVALGRVSDERVAARVHQATPGATDDPSEPTGWDLHLPLTLLGEPVWLPLRTPIVEPSTPTAWSTATPTMSVTPLATATATASTTPTGTAGTSSPTPTQVVGSPSATTGPALPEYGPDLVVSKLLIGMEDVDCYYEQPLGTWIEFKNQGTSPTGPFVVRVNMEYTPYSAGLAPGESARLWFASFGNFAVGVVDHTKWVRETDESNNELMMTLPIPTPPRACPQPTPATDPPDLIVQDMSFGLGDVACYYGQPLGTWIDIANIGSGGTGPFVLTVNGIRRAFPTGLAAGVSARRWYYNYLDVGEGDSVGVVDSTSVVVESNEDNNVLRVQLPVPTLPAACPPPTDVPGP